MRFHRQLQVSIVPLAPCGRPDEFARIVHSLSSEYAGYSNGVVYSINNGSIAGCFFAT